MKQQHTFLLMSKIKASTFETNELYCTENRGKITSQQVGELSRFPEYFCVLHFHSLGADGCFQ